MKIKDYKCKCGHDDFFFADKGNQIGIYCSYCGKWFKWADKDEQNLRMKQEPKTGRWLDWTDDRNDYLKCSICGYGEEGEVKFGEYTPYCPMCGAKMESEEEDD